MTIGGSVATWASVVIWGWQQLRGGVGSGDGDGWWTYRSLVVVFAQAQARVVDEHIDKGKLVDCVQEQRRRKWRWAGHVARRKDGRWTRWMLDWQPLRGLRAPGRQVTRWEDSLVNFMRGPRQSWTQLAENREAWRALEDDYVKAGI